MSDLHAIRHSQAHVLAAAIQKLWPKTKFGVGPVIDDGFYYDVDPGETISEEDLPKIEAEMQKIIKANQPFEQYDLSVDEAIKWAQDNGQDFKVELLNDLKREGTTSAKDLDAEQLGVGSEDTKVEKVSFYKCGDFTDLCRGPHVESTGKIGVFKLHKVAGAYWRGDEKKPQLQRVYGWGFVKQKELDDHIKNFELAKERDHRKLGKELDLFTFSELVGSGLPMYTTSGTIIREKLIALSEGLREKIGFQRVWSPHITKTDLYKTSGHWDKFGDELFLVKSQETSDELALKPMNCPHHSQVYESQSRSYRDLPLKFMETTTNYRDEKSGELHGLSRVRSLSQDDSHVYCRLDQAEGIIGELVDAIFEFYKAINMDKLRIRLSLRDNTDAYLGDKDKWAWAQEKIEKVAKDKKLDYFTVEGEAAFYGPKIDFMAEDSIGREWQVGTVQFDFVQPERFELTYINEKGEAEQPYMIHCAVMGSFDRFFSVYIEHTGGHFPFWLAPEQVRVLSVNDSVARYWYKDVQPILDEVVLMKPLKYNELRYSLDNRNETLGKKIREAETQKIPVIMIIGPKDQAANQVSVRIDGKDDKVKLGGLKEYLLGQ